MPIAIDPSSRLPVVLSSDEGKPNPPTFYVRPLTVRETRTADTIDERMRAASSEPGADAYAPLMDGIRVALVDWRNVTGLDGKPITFDPQKLEDILGVDEAVELMQKIMRAGVLLKEEKKRLESPPSSSTANSVSNAPEEIALTAPANASP